EHLAVGQRVELQPAQGDMSWPMHSDTVCVLDAGSGLTPLLGLLREVLVEGIHGPVPWLDFVPHPGQGAWPGTMQALAAGHPN
ncbi:ferredoxin reductase, partial [Pseudomonas aeruginosa]